MRMHIELEDDLVRRIDELAGPRGRSRFVRNAIQWALEWSNRWDLIESSIGSISGEGHEWDEDPAGWVRAQRAGDDRRVG